MKTYIITDSTSEISAAVSAELNLIVVPLSVSCGDTLIRDDGSMKSSEFYKKLESGVPCKTHPILEDTFTILFKGILQEKGAKIFGVFVSSKLSETYNAAASAAEKLKSGRIFLSDSQTVSGALGLLCYIAADMRARGYDAKRIKTEIDLLIPRTELIVLSTLKYIKAGGKAKISLTRSLLGTFTAITIKDGSINPLSKFRLKKATYIFLFKYLEKNLPEKNYAPVFINSGAPKLSDELMKLYSQSYGMERCIISTVGIACGTHFGPGAVGMAYIKKEIK